MRTGCSVRICPGYHSKKNQHRLFNFLFKFLTISLFAFSFGVQISEAAVFDQEKTSTYLRWNLFTSRDQLIYQKKGQSVFLKTLNQGLYQSLKEELSKLAANNSYISDIKFLDVDNATQSYAIQIDLKEENIETFSFYREREKKYVVDFWVDGDSVSLNKASVLKTPVQPENATPAVEVKAPEAKKIEESAKVTPGKIINKAKRKVSNAESKDIQNEENVLKSVREDQVLSKIVVDPTKPIALSEEEEEKLREESKKPFRDFRYGATYIWDYEPIIPAYKSPVNIKTKIPEYFFPIPNRDFKKDEKEAHLQLTINLYRKQKWGLMYKSIKLFQQKFGDKTEWETIEFLKVNAILRENIEKPNPEIYKSALNILTILSEKTDNYELKKAINKYLLTHYMEKGEYLKSLQISKAYFAGSRDNFDFEESSIPAEAMFYSLTKLGQIEKIEDLSQEKTIKKILPAQRLIAYQTYALLKANESKKVIELYEKNKNAMLNSVDPVILYNTAEAHFRSGNYQEAFNLFTKFSNEFSHEFVSSHALLRVALSADLLDKNNNEVLGHYKKAIDSAIDDEIAYEARIRYVAFRTVRKKVLDEADLETRIFLEQDKKFNIEVNKNLTKLLQQVRLRTLIVDGKYKEALAYLSLIPMLGMSKIDARVYDGDGAEIVYGLISDYFKNAEFTMVIKTWQAYKDRYLDKVALDPFINYVVGASYVKLGLFKGFDEVYANFESLKGGIPRSYPMWVERNFQGKASTLLTELVLIKDFKLKNWDLAQKNIEKFEKENAQFNKTNYFKGLIAFNQKDYKNAVTHFENFFSKNENRVIYDPIELAEMIRAYTDSVYELGQTDKFLKVSEAVLNDTTSIGTKSAFIQSVRERITYLGIEIYTNRKSKENQTMREEKMNSFIKAFPKSTYVGRVTYLLGQVLIEGNKNKEAREVLNKLINDTSVSSYIKEMAKSEIGLLNIKEKNI